MYTKNKKQISLLIFSLILIVFGGIVVNKTLAERSWEDGQVEKQNNVWDSSIKKWEALFENWKDKRERLHDQYFDDYDVDAEYCDSANNCYKEELLSMYVTRSNGNFMELDTNDNDVDGNDDNFGKFENGDKWQCANGGQVLEFKGAEGIYWDSSNHGQVVTYKDREGNKWESHNKGQVVIFTNRNGEEWEVSNHGQVVEYKDSSGKTWSGSDDDTVDDMR